MVVYLELSVITSSVGSSHHSINQLLGFRLRRGLEDRRGKFGLFHPQIDVAIWWNGLGVIVGMGTEVGGFVSEVCIAKEVDDRDRHLPALKLRQSTSLYSSSLELHLE